MVLVFADFWLESCVLLRRRKDLQEGVVVFPESEAVLVVAKVVWLPIVPVEPVSDIDSWKHSHHSMVWFIWSQVQVPGW